MASTQSDDLVPASLIRAALGDLQTSSLEGVCP
jgi:hypothetical protein